MFRSRRFLLSAIILLGFGTSAVVSAQDGCISPFQYPLDPYSPDPSGALVEVSTCIYHQEYTHFTGFESGNTYRFDISGNGYITLREGTVEGPVLASGYSYVIHTATSNSDIYAHYTKNEDCVLQTGCQSNSVQLLLDCVPPQVWYSWEQDCETGDFQLTLDVSSLGDASSLTVTYTTADGTETFNDVGTGALALGTFSLGDMVDISVAHPTSAECDINLTGLEPTATCPFVLECGGPAMDINFCYENNEDLFWYFTGDADGSILLSFDSGTIGGGDVFTIYDGPDASSPVLFMHDTWDQLELSGLTFIATGSDMYMTLVSDGFGSCNDFSNDEVFFSVACLNCNLPAVNPTIVDDCENNAFSIILDVTSTGDGSTVDIEYIVNGEDAQTVAGVGVGETEIGPFEVNDLVQVIIHHEADGMCDIDLGELTDGNTCPTLVVCGEEDLSQTYCYENNDSMHWFYELVGEDGALFLQFNSGTIESNFFETLVIYDGPDNTYPILFEHTSEDQLDLSGIAATSTSGFLYMEMSSDGSVSCEDGLQTSWDWIVTCLDCTPAVATYEIVQDCDNFQYYIDVNISSLGSDPELTILNNSDAPEVEVTAPGNALVGPFASGTPVQLTLVNDGNALCNVLSPMMVNPLCPTMICGTTPLDETYCYGPNEDMAWAYAIGGDGQLRLRFNRGTIESVNWDGLTIYDGPDNQSPVLFTHDTFNTVDLGPPGSAINGPGITYLEVDVTSTGQNLYMEVTSDGSVHCQSMTWDEFEWEVFCEGCPAPGVTYNLEADCEHLVYKASVVVSEIAGEQGLQITEMTSGETITAGQVNTYNFTTFFDLDSVINFEVVDMDNAGCTYESGPMVYTRDSCVINSCGTDNYDLCYENDEDRWYTYRSMGDMPVAIFFHAGQMLANDNITLYNGLSDTANVIFSGNNTGNLAGITANSSNIHNALTLRIRSNASGSCADGEATVPLAWDVGCGFVGVEEMGQNSFSLFPNPTNGQLTIALGELDGAFTIRILDMSGRMALEQHVSANGGPTTTLDLSMLQNGQYMVQLITSEWVGTRAFQMMH